MNLHLFLWVASAGCFALGFVNVPAGVNWIAGGLCCAALTQVL